MYALFYLVWVIITLILFIIFQVTVRCLISRGNDYPGEVMHQTNSEASISTEMAPLSCIAQKR
jgi:hypothetical protein